MSELKKTNSLFTPRTVQKPTNNAKIKNFRGRRYGNNFGHPIKTTNNVAMESGSVSKQQEAPLPVPVQGGYLLVAPENIVYCKAAGNYTHIFLSDGKELTLCKRLKELAAMLQGPKFYRTHQSYLVNLAHVVMWARENGNQLRLATGAAAPVARLRVKGLKNKLNMC